MSRQQSYVIIGNGIAGITTAEILRAEDAACAITIIADDPFPAYYRPALKDYLGGSLPEQKLWARPTTFYQELNLYFVPGRVVSINPYQRCVQLHNGQYINYDKLLLANGARPRTLSCPGLNLAGVSTLRTIADYQEIMRRLDRARRVVVCGSGTLALESAETLHHRGYQVTHLLRGDTLWSEVLDPVASDMVLQEELRDGIDVRTGEEIREIVGRHGEVSHVVTTSGVQIPCELVLVAIGIEPLTDFIRASGIACGRGVKVDNGMRTNIPEIYAVGDVIETTDEFTGRTRVLGQWYPAIQQAQVAAYNMLGVLTPDHPFYPGTNSAGRASYLNYYNATFLYGLDCVAVGLTTCPSAPGYQELVAEPQPRSYRKVILKHGVIVGVLLLGDRRQGLAFKRAIDHRVNLAPVARQLFAENFDLAAWLDQQRLPAPILTIEKTGFAASSFPGQSGMIDISQYQSRNNMASREADAYLVPIPHPAVLISLEEVRLNQYGQSQMITIGREAGVSLFLDHRSVSRLHAEIVCVDGEYVLRDTGSSNGTFVNGAPLAQGNNWRLCHHEQVRFGDIQFRFELRPRISNTFLGVASAANANFMYIQGTELHASVSRLIPDAILRSLTDAPTLMIVNQHMATRVIALEYGRRYTLGRDSNNEIMLDDPSSSRLHAEIFTASDGFYARDLGSRYGVFVNAIKINNAYHLSHGDRIVLGNTLFYFSYPPMTAVKQLTTHATAALQPAADDLHTPVGASHDQSGSYSASTRLIAPTHFSASRHTRADLAVSTQMVGRRLPIVEGLTHRQAVQPMDETQVKFEIGMCIGCDRCMDACPIPMSSQVTIAELNYSTITERVPSIIARFTHECIMCGSCVPVCPVDNHRDLLMLSLKQRLGTSWNTKPDMNQVATALPAGWTLPLMISHLREQFILRDPAQVPDSYLLHILAASKQCLLAPAAIVIQEGDYGRDLYLILEGVLELSATDVDNVELPVAILRRGEYVGEDGMLTGHPYKASARAQAPSLLLQVPEQALHRLMELVPGVRAHFEQLNYGRSLKSILKRMALFQGVADHAIEGLMRQTAVKQYERDEQLFAEDNSAGYTQPPRESLHILLEGFVKVARHTRSAQQQQTGERIIAYRQGGDYFLGGLDLMGDGQAVTATTINRCRVAEVPRHALLTLFQQYPEVQQRFSVRLREYLETTISTQGYIASTRTLQPFTVRHQADQHVQAGLHSLVSDGVVEGTEVLVIDLDKCIHCDECEEACEQRHGHSRMNRKGMVIGNISIATACRQCQDPVCMLCSRAGIARHPNGEVYITESCIGCGICAERCPYGAISIVSLEEDADALKRTDAINRVPTWQRLMQYSTRERKRRALPVIAAAKAGGSQVAPGPLNSFSPKNNGYEEMRKKVAIKCDLCAGYSDQACVEACPMGAAVRIQPTTFFGSTEEILQRRAR